MTPAIVCAENGGVTFSLHRYQHDPSAPSYGLEAADKLGLDPGQVFKTLIAAIDGKRLVVAVVPVAGQLDLKALAKAAGGKQAAMADKGAAERSSGYLLGGISPLGQKKRLATFIDSSAEQWPEIYVSAGRRGLEIALAPAGLIALTGGLLAAIGRSS